MERMKLLLSFLFGGAAVVLSYLVSMFSPWKVLGGIAAAFPSVMIVSVMMVGIGYGSKKAAEIARGSVYGMAGCAICVVSVLLFMQFSQMWWMSILFGLVLWYISSSFLFKLREVGHK